MRTDNAKNYSKFKTVEARIKLRQERIKKIDTEITKLEKIKKVLLKKLGLKT